MLWWSSLASLVSLMGLIVLLEFFGFFGAVLVGLGGGESVGTITLVLCIILIRKRLMLTDCPFLGA